MYHSKTSNNYIDACTEVTERGLHSLRNNLRNLQKFDVV